MNDLQSASVDRIEEAQKSLKRLASEVPHDSPFYQQLNEQLDMVTQELENIKATKAFEHLQLEAEGATKTFEQTRAEAEFVKQTVENIDTASLKQLKLAEQTAKGIKETAGQGTLEYNGAATSLDKIREKLSEIDAQERKVVTTAAQYNQTMKAIHKDEKVVADEMELIDRTLKNLSTASVRDLEFSIKALKEQIQDTERSGDSVEQLTEKLKLLNAELKKVQDMQKPDKNKENVFARGMNFLNKNWGAITQTLAAYSGLRDVVKGSVEAFAEMDQEMNNVRKYTGQSIEEVQRMNETFKRMDTRTPREQLNQLAGSAGRLGITSTSAVLEFVDAADKINVALGDDLGQGAVDQIGKLAMAFGEDETKGLRGAMLATGSAVNELAQNSAAQAGYLVDFAARLSGIGIQAGLTQSQILGLGAAMDENMQRDEMAATALSQIITKMTTDSETFARIAGKNVEEFANLVRTDMNSALMQFFESMNKKGGFTELAPLFEEMGLDGQRAIGVLSTLSSKIDDVRRHQELATEAYEKGTSVIDEFNVQNDTYQAKLEKARKTFFDLRVELGEKLLPLASASISTTSMVVRLLNTVITFTAGYQKTLMTLAAAVIALTIAENKRLIVMRYTAFVNNVLIKGTKQLFLLLSRHPYAMVATAIATVVALMADLASKNKLVSVETAALNRIRKDAASRMGEEQAKLDILIQTARSEFSSLENRRNAIEELNKVIPGYNGLLDETTGKYRENKAALDDYLKSLTRKYEIEGAKELLAEIGKEVAEASVAIADAQRQLPDALAEEGELAMQTGGVYGNTRANNLRVELDAQNRVLEDAGKKRQAIYDAYPELLGVDDQQAAFTIYIPKEDPSYQQQNNTQNNDTRKFWEQQLEERREKLEGLRADANATAAAIEEAAKKVKEAEDKMEIFTGAKAGAKQERAEDKARRERERKADDAAKAETEQQLAELTHRYAMGQILYCDYVDEQERIQLEGIERRMLIYRTESLEYQKLNRQREELLLNGSEESQKLSLAQMKQGHEQRKAALEEQAWRENMTEQRKNEMVFREDMRFLDEQRILYRQGTLERINLEREIEERQQQHSLQQEQYYQQQLEQVREQYLGLSNTRQMQIAMQGLDELHKRGLLKEKEYQIAKAAIQAQYTGYQTQSERAQQTGANMLTVASDAAKKQLDGKLGSNTPFLGDIMLYQTTMEKLKEMYGNDKENHDAYLAAKRQATGNFCNDLAQKMQTAYNTVNQVMSAASSYFSAQQEYETAQVQKKYEKQIEAAGNNQQKVKKLQEKQQKEEAAIKTKYAKRAAAIQYAQAVAQTAISAINAYSSAAAIPVTGHILAPIAAAMAIAAGMIQIATIRKQQQVQAAGYYKGGFTGGTRYRKEAGVVHEGEFVASHQAVQNPAVLPFLQFLDQAQRNNTVGSLTPDDVSRSIAAPAAAYAPAVPVPLVAAPAMPAASPAAATALADPAQHRCRHHPERLSRHTQGDRP
ncbi:MAG: phage tail tape measure protein [Prevotella sp.]|nr:phage tail tape measure protein [Prevotella sp.]